MPDREKVFDALRNCITEPKCKDCPWDDCERFGHKKTEVPVTLLLDVLELLREQEAVPVEWQGIPLCGACKAAFLNLRPQKYCHECGRKVKWDD